MHKFLVPCWNDASFFFSLGLIDPNLRDLSWDVISDWISDNAGPELKRIFEYILMNCVGDTLTILKKDDPVDIYSELISLEDSINQETNRHINYHVKGKRLGDFEVRIRKVHRDIEKEELSKIELEYKLMGWFYSLVNNSMSQRTPISYHFKILTLPHSYAQIFDCQQFVGFHFLHEILAQMKAHATKQGKSLMASPNLPSRGGYSPKNPAFSNNSSHITGNFSQVMANKSLRYQPSIRGNIVAYLWGSKLAKFVKSLESLHSPLEGFGDIKLINGALRGSNSLSHLFASEKAKMEAFLNKITENVDEIYDIDNLTRTKGPEEKIRVLTGITETQTRVSQTLASILHSESYRYLRKKENLRVFPQELEVEHLRIFCNREQIIEILLHGEFETLNFYYEINDNQNKTQSTKPNIHYNDYCLMNIRPEIKSKCALVAMVYYLIENEKLLFERVKGENTEILESMFAGIREGFHKTYWLDSQDLDFLQFMHKETVVDQSFVKRKVPDLIKLEVFFYALEQISRNIDFLNTIKSTIEEKHSEKFKKINQFNTNLALAEKDQYKSLNLGKKQCEKYFDEQLNDLNQKKIKQRETCKRLFETLSRFPIYYNFEELLLREDETKSFNVKVKIPREKYFRPFLNEKWEYNLDDERYMKDLNETFRYPEDNNEKYLGAVFYYNHPNDPLQQKWLEKRPFKVRNLREAPKEEKDGVLVEKIMPNAEKMLRNAIDKEIKKFKEFKKGGNENEEENKRKDTALSLAEIYKK